MLRRHTFIPVHHGSRINSPRRKVANPRDDDRMRHLRRPHFSTISAVGLGYYWFDPSGSKSPTGSRRWAFA